MKETCCDAWWKRLTPTQKKWVHYYFFDIEDDHLTNRLGSKMANKMHDSRFREELVVEKEAQNARVG